MMYPRYVGLRIKSEKCEGVKNAKGEEGVCYLSNDANDKLIPTIWANDFIFAHA